MKRLRGGSAARLLAMLLGLAVGGACGVPADDGPQVIASRDLPADLLDPNPGSSTTLPESAGTTTVDVYLLEETGDGVRLVSVPREVTQARVPNERLATLFNGAQAPEIESGITSGIPGDTVLLDVTTDEENREVMVDVSDDIFTIEGEALARAFAQIVWTATEISAGGYRQVRFSVEGEPTPVLDDDGAEQEGPVTRAHYDAFRPLD
jgi:spore germination protein GerM